MTIFKLLYKDIPATPGDVAVDLYGGISEDLDNAKQFLKQSVDSSDPQFAQLSRNSMSDSMFSAIKDYRCMSDSLIVSKYQNSTIEQGLNELIIFGGNEDTSRTLNNIDRTKAMVDAEIVRISQEGKTVVKPTATGTVKNELNQTSTVQDEELSAAGIAATGIGSGVAGFLIARMIHKKKS